MPLINFQKIMLGRCKLLIIEYSHLGIKTIIFWSKGQYYSIQFCQILSLIHKVCMNTVFIIILIFLALLTYLASINATRVAREVAWWWVVFEDDRCGSEMGRWRTAVRRCRKCEGDKKWWKSMDDRREGGEMQGQHDGYETTCVTTVSSWDIALQSSTDLKINKKCNGITQTGAHSIPKSWSAFCNIVSLTAANTSWMLVVSVACIRLEKLHSN
jgi:hypothetical protein